MAISVGAAAPDFTLKDQNMKDVKLSDFQGKKNVVIVFYPLDWSPVCTNEHVCFVNGMKGFEQLDAAVLGLSVDSVWSHKAFAEKMGIQYSLLADFQPRGAVADKFGVFLPEKGITGRAIAIVDRGGKIAWFKSYDIPTVPDMKEVAHEVHELVEKGAITGADFRDFVFTNPVKMWTGLNPDFFKGTAVEKPVSEFLAR